MKTLRIVELIKSDAVDCDVTVKGWVRTKRGNKNVAFIALNDGSCVASIQVVVELDPHPRRWQGATRRRCVRSPRAPASVSTAGS